MNKCIINSEIVLFLGAGASAFLEKPLMGDFIDVLLKDETMESNEVKIIETIIKARDKDLEAILDEIDGICAKSYFKGTEPRNYFKDFFDFNQQSILGRTLLTAQEPTLPSKSDFGRKYEQLCDKCRNLRWKIYDVIFRTYYDVSALKIKELYEPLFDILNKKAEKNKITIPVFTTNYDKSIETLCTLLDKIEYIDGFKHIEKQRTDKWTPTTFDNFKPAKNKINISLFKLHGSIFWYRIGKDIVYSHVATNFPTDQKIEPVILYPNNTKDILGDPFITSYCYLQKCLDNAKFIIFIGYSFRDYITITFLKSALRYNPKSKVLILDPQATRLCEKRFGYYKKRIKCLDVKFTNESENYKNALLEFLGLKNE